MSDISVKYVSNAQEMNLTLATSANAMSTSELLLKCASHHALDPEDVSNTMHMED